MNIQNVDYMVAHDMQYEARVRTKKHIQAKQYAAEAKERNKPKHHCEHCRQQEMLKIVQRIVSNWK